MQQLHDDESLEFDSNVHCEHETRVFVFFLMLVEGFNESLITDVECNSSVG